MLTLEVKTMMIQSKLWNGSERSLRNCQAPSTSQLKPQSLQKSRWTTRAFNALLLLVRSFLPIQLLYNIYYNYTSLHIYKLFAVGMCGIWANRKLLDRKSTHEEHPSADVQHQRRCAVVEILFPRVAKWYVLTRRLTNPGPYPHTPELCRVRGLVKNISKLFRKNNWTKQESRETPEWSKRPLHNFKGKHMTFATNLCSHCILWGKV